MPNASSPSGSLVTVEAPSTLMSPPAATPMVPSLRSAVALLPTSTVPSTVRVPVLVIGPSRVRPGWSDVPVAAMFTAPSFCSPDTMVKLGAADPASEGPAVTGVPPFVDVPAGVASPIVAAVPMVRLLPADTVSSPTECVASESVTFAFPLMHTSTPVPFGTPVLQLAAESQSPDGLVPVQLSLQLNASVGGALPSTNEDALKTVVVPATTTRPATTAPRRRATWRRERRPVHCTPASRRPTLPSLGPCSGQARRPPTARRSQPIVVVAPRWW